MGKLYPAFKSVVILALVLGLVVFKSYFAVAEEELVVIDKSNVEEYKDYLLPCVIGDVNRLNYSFQFIEERIIQNHPRDFLEASQENIGKIKLDPDGGLINYQGGLPFPNVKPGDPDDALKIAWNCYRVWRGDDLTYTCHIKPGPESFVTVQDSIPHTSLCRRWCIDKYGNNILSDLYRWDFFTSYRVRLKPKSFKGFEDVEYFRMYLITSPRDVASTSHIEKRYWDPTKDDEMWIYLPSLRRIRRFPTSARSSTRAPADYNWDDPDFTAKPPQYTFKFLEEKRIIAARSLDHTPMLHINNKGSGLPDNQVYGYYDVYLIEQIPKDPHYGYSKRIAYVDKISWYPIYVKMFDRKGELWKEFMEFYQKVERTDKSETVTRGAGFGFFDLQSGHRTLVDASQATLDFGLDPPFFAIPNLLRLSRGEKGEFLRR